MKKKLGFILSALTLFFVSSPVFSFSAPSPIVEVKRELGDLTPRISGAIDPQNTDSFPSFSPLIRGLGQKIQFIKIAEYTTKKIEDVHVDEEVFSVFEHKKGDFISKYYLNKNVIVGYVLHDFLPVTYQPNEEFLLQIYSFPNDCSEYLRAKTLPTTRKFDCYRTVHSNYTEEYIFEITVEPHLISRVLIVDAFYPNILEEQAKAEINRVLDEVLLEE